MAWWGGLADRLKLSGEVDSKDFKSILSGVNASNGKAIVRTHEGRVPAVDIAFSVPKSLSAAYVEADKTTRSTIDNCCQEAVKEVLAFAQKNLPLIRTGKAGVNHEFGQFMAALFPHYVNRNGDPSLHIHSVIPNMVVGEDGKVRHLNTRELFKWARTLGPLFRASLAKHLTEKLGLSLETPEPINGKRCSWFEVVGVPKSLTKLWSSRKSEIDEFLTPHGLKRDSATAQVRSSANVQTRQSKEKLPHIDVLYDRWKHDAKEHGFDFGMISTRTAPPSKREIASRYRIAVKQSLQELTASESHFTGRDLLRLVAERMQDIGISPNELNAKVEQTLSRSKSILHLSGQGFERIFTTKEIWKLEEKLLADADKQIRRSGATVSNWHLKKTLKERPSISKEQAEAVKALTQSKGSLRLLQGVAGAGKTYTLDAVRDAFERQGYNVIGGAISGLAKETLAKEAEIKSRTVASYLCQLDNAKKLFRARRPSPFSSKTVLILDEASMIDLRSMQKLMRAAQQAKATVVLVGDNKQLQSIGPGGPFRYFLKQITPAILSDNRRQVLASDRESVAFLREGRVIEALTSYLERGRLKICETRQAAAKELIKKWENAGAIHSPQQHSIFTETKQEAEYLNKLCQQRRLQAGVNQADHSVALGQSTFYKGDRVLFNRSDRMLGIENGYRGEVVGVQEKSNSIRIRLDDPKPGMPKTVLVSLSRKSEGSITLGYAATTHKMQGQTIDHAYVLLGGGMTDHSMAYTQLTRGKHSTNLFVDSFSAGENLSELAKTMSKDRTKTLAHEHRAAKDQSPSLSY